MACAKVPQKKFHTPEQIFITRSNMTLGFREKKLVRVTKSSTCPENPDFQNGVKLDILKFCP